MARGPLHRGSLRPKEEQLAARAAAVPKVEQKFLSGHLHVLAQQHAGFFNLIRDSGHCRVSGQTDLEHGVSPFVIVMIFKGRIILGRACHALDSFDAASHGEQPFDHLSRSHLVKWDVAQDIDSPIEIKVRTANFQVSTSTTALGCLAYRLVDKISSKHRHAERCGQSIVVGLESFAPRQPGRIRGLPAGDRKAGCDSDDRANCLGPSCRFLRPQVAADRA